MKVALLSNSIVNRTIAFQLSYVLGRKIGSIFLPLENHNRDEMFFGGREKIFIQESIDDIIKSSDVIIASKHEIFHKLPKRKEAVLIPNPWESECCEMPHHSNALSQKHAPRILILSLGEFTDVYYTEILVNKLLNDLGAVVYQTFSKETRQILSCLSNHNILNQNLSTAGKENADVVVFSMDAAKYKNDAKFISDLYQISPNLTFICTEKNTSNINKICNLAEIACKVGLVIRSPYISYDVGKGVKYPVLSGIGRKKPYHNSLDSDLEEVLKEVIKGTLYFPLGTKFL